ncbi:MAG: SRPBCC family protein, partial [Halieaceae bacterium]
MKTPIIALIVVLSVLLMWLPRKSVEAELVIAAPPEVVWAALTDTDCYAEWNPIFVNVMGVMQPGNEL